MKIKHMHKNAIRNSPSLWEYVFSFSNNGTEFDLLFAISVRWTKLAIYWRSYKTDKPRK